MEEKYLCKGNNYDYFSYIDLLNEIRDITGSRYIGIGIYDGIKGHMVPAKYDIEVSDSPFINFTSAVLHKSDTKRFAKMTKQKIVEFRKYTTKGEPYALAIANFTKELEPIMVKYFLSKVENIHLSILLDKQMYVRLNTIRKVMYDITSIIKEIIIKSNHSKNAFIYDKLLFITNTILNYKDNYYHELGTLNIKKSIINLKKCIETTIKSLNKRLKYKNIAINYTIDHTISSSLYTDYTRIEQILVIIITNLTNKNNKKRNIHLNVLNNKISEFHTRIIFTLNDDDIEPDFVKLNSILLCTNIASTLGGKLIINEKHIEFEIPATFEFCPDYTNKEQLESLKKTFIGVIDPNKEYRHKIFDYAKSYGIYCITATNLDELILKIEDNYVTVILNGLLHISEKNFEQAKIAAHIVHTSKYIKKYTNPFGESQINKYPNTQMEFINVITNAIFGKKIKLDIDCLLISTTESLNKRLQFMGHRTKSVLTLTDALDELSEDLFKYDIIFIQRNIDKFLTHFSSLYDNFEDEMPEIYVIGRKKYNIKMKNMTINCENLIKPFTFEKLYNILTV